MNIDDLTYGELKKIAQMFSGENKDPVGSDLIGSDLIGSKIIVRARNAGVHFGELVKVDGQNVHLKHSRRLWYWKVKDAIGISLSDVAKFGISDNSKICSVVVDQIITDACELMSVSSDCIDSVENADVYNP